MMKKRANLALPFSTMEDEDSMTFTGRMGTDVKPQNVV